MPTLNEHTLTQLVEAVLPNGPVFTSICCERLYVGSIPAQSCRTCTKVPRVVQIDKMEDVQAAFLELMRG